MIFPKSNQSLWLIGVAVVLYTVYHITRAIWLAYFSPLAKFPGSKWAAISEYWEAWYNIGSGPEKRGQTLFVLERMHRDSQYGSAIRLGPNEIHIYDPRFYHQLYSLNTRYYKDPSMHKVLGAPSSTVAEADPELHKRRRAPLESLFSRQSILKLEPMLMDKLNICCSRFDEVYAANKSIKLEWALKSLTIDMVSEFCFGQSLGALYDDDFMSGPVQVFRAYLHSLHVIKAFPFVRSISQILPYAIAKRLSKTIKMANELETFSRKRVDAFIKAYEGGSKPNFPTVMERLLTPQEEKNFTVPSRDGLRDEILTMISAGNDTTGITSMVGIYQIIRNPAIQSRLLAELKTVLPGPSSEAPYVQIEKLPYLSAVIKESLRYASAAASRTPRLVPAGGVYLPDGRFIPAGTRVGMAIYHIHYNPNIFPSPREFIPERWLDAESGGSMPDHLVEMNRFLVPFSKGTRSCIGINLAHMELYIIMAYLIRRYDFQTDTTDADMRWDDMVVAWFHGDFTVKAKRRSE